MPKVLISVYTGAIVVNVFIVASAAFMSDWSLASLGLASGALCSYGLFRTIKSFTR